MDILTTIARFKSLRAAGQLAEGLAELRQALRRGLVDAGDLDQVGRLLIRHADAMPKNPAPLSILLLGQCTTTWLVPALTAVAWGRGHAVNVRDGGYDNLIQDLAALGSKPDVVILLPWHQRLLASDSRTSVQRIDDELALLTQAWEMVQKSGVRLVQVGYDWDGPGPEGHHLAGREGGRVDMILKLNDHLRAGAPRGTYFVDLPQVSGEVGRKAFYDPRSYHWTKQPFTRPGVARLAEHLWAGVRAVTTGPKKVLVLDLDDTLWGGVVGEVGPMGVGLGDNPDGEAFRDLQREIRGLADRGVLLAVCSKNNPQDAREVFEKNAHMVLKLSDFAAFHAGWDAKPLALQRIAQTLRLGLDSFVFFDDSPAEREHVLQALPEVEVVDVPPDPAEYVRTLHAGLWFEAAAVTDADRTRVDHYRDEQQRRRAEQAAGSVQAYLESLQMIGDLRVLDESDMDRAVQLLGKTNQFNLTTRRHSMEGVRRMLAEPNSLGLTLRLADKFGDAGLISLVLAVPKSQAQTPTLRLDTWLMSCRVISRTVEDFLMNHLARCAGQLGYQTLEGEFIPTAKNQLVADFYDRLGFEKTPPVDGVIKYRLNLSQYQLRPSPIKLKC